MYYVKRHQIIWKLLECHPGVVDCQSELKLFCGNGVSIFKAIQNHRQKKWNMRFGELLLCNSTSDCLETAWVSIWGSELSIWIEIVLWNQGVSFLKPSKIKDRKSGILYLECFYFVIQHQIVLKLLECHPGAVDCQSELKLFCGNGVSIFRAIQNQRQIRYNLSFGELLLCHSTSDCLETTWVSSWGSGLSIWIEIVLWERGVLFLEPFKIKGRSGRMWDFESFYYVLCKTTSNHLETAWVSSWGSGLSIWIEIVLWKRSFHF